MISRKLKVFSVRCQNCAPVEIKKREREREIEMEKRKMIRGCKKRAHHLSNSLSFAGDVYTGKAFAAKHR